MKKRFLSILFAMLLVVLPFTLIGCNTPDDSTSNYGTEGQLLTLQDYHNEIKSIADFCGVIITHLSPLVKTQETVFHQILNL